MARSHDHQIRVYIEDTDAGGIVYYANYFRFTERARTEWIRTFGYGKDFISMYRLMFVVRSLESSFHQPAVLDDIVTVRTSIVRLAKTYIDLAQNVFRGDNELLADMHVRIALIDYDNRRPARIPERLYNLLDKSR